MSNIKQSRIDMILTKRYVSYDQCIDGVHYWHVKGSIPNTMYVITNEHAKDLWSCECPSYLHDEHHWIPSCKHIEAVMQFVKSKNDVDYSEDDDEAIASTETLLTNQHDHEGMVKRNQEEL